MNENPSAKPAQPPFWRRLPFFGSGRPLVTVIELSGVIGEMGPGRRGLTLARVEQALDAAFKPSRLAAVALAINSPGGSPVQSALIHDAIRRRAKEKGTPVFAFIEDVGASGGYLLALAGDEIYADASSIVGSIGVISASFGFPDALSRLGIERRVHTAGENKSQHDPFKPEDPADVARLKAILEDMHSAFIARVETRRGERLRAGEETFSGAFWTAGPAEQQGLIDGKAHLGDFMRARFGDDVKLKRIAPGRGSLLRRMLGGEARLPLSGLVDPAELIGAVEERAIWARYGL